MKDSKKDKGNNVLDKKIISKKIVEKPKIHSEKKTLNEQKKELEKISVKQESSIKEEIILDETAIEEDFEEKIAELHKPEILEKKTEIKATLKHDDTFIEDKNKVEALLFAYGKYIEELIISELCDIDKKKIRKILEELRKDYEQKNSALTIFQESSSWKINVREKYLSIVRKIVADTELPKSVMETLAVIAWKSPIYQSEVVQIRGNKCYDHIVVLEETGFVLKDKKGRSYVLKTTDKFYNYFEIDHGHLKSIFEEVKVPIKEEQKTLEEDTIIPESIGITEKIEHIEVKKWTETEEEKDSHRIFLESMEGKLNEAEQKNTLLDEEFPSPKRETIIIETRTNEIKEIPIEENTEAESNNVQINAPETPVDETKKPKSLTKKQLEKKFKDDILRVREKMEKKK